MERTTIFLKYTSLKSLLHNRNQNPNTQYSSCIFIVFAVDTQGGKWLYERTSVFLLYRTLAGRDGGKLKSYCCNGDDTKTAQCGPS